jgi:segregation and condensation protein B
MDTQTAELDSDVAGVPQPEGSDTEVAEAGASESDLATTDVPAAGPSDATAEEPADDAARLAPLLEGLLFAAGSPVPVARLVDALDGPSRAEVLRGIEVLAARLEEDGRGVRLVRVAGGYQLRTIAEHGPWVRRLLGSRPPRLSRAMLETVAIIAYRQPCTRPEIEAIRGVDVDAVLNTLLERRLVKIVGRKDAPGRPILYGTTRDFLEVFSLPDLDALPPLQELGALAEALELPPPGEVTVLPLDRDEAAAGDTSGGAGAESPATDV